MAKYTGETQRDEHSVIGGVPLKKVGIFDNAGNQIISFGGSGGNPTINAGPNFIGLATTVPAMAWPDPKGYIGLVTITGSLAASSGNVTLDPGSKTGIAGNVTLTDSKGFIGLATVNIGSSNATLFAVVNTAEAGITNSIVTVANTPLSTTLSGNVTITDSKGYIGLVSVAQPLSTTLGGNVTLDPGSKTGIAGNVTLSDSKGFIGLVSIGGGSVGINNSPSVQDFGQFFPSPQSIASGGLGPLLLDQYGRLQTTNIGNVTLSDSKGYIGLATVTPGTSWPDPKTYIGLATIDIGSNNGVAVKGNVTIDSGNVSLKGNVTLTDSKGFIGLVSVSGFANPLPVSFSGNVTLDVGSKTGIVGNVTLTDSKGYIGLVSISHAAWADPKTYVGLVTVTGGLSLIGNVTLDAGSKTAIIGNVTLSDPKGFIGLATIVPSYGSNVTIFTQIISASGNTTIFVAPASNRFFIKNLHVSSLGRAELEIRSGATTIIPFTSLSTTSGFATHYGEMGLPGRAQADGFVANLNGAATVSIMTSVYFQA